LAEARDLRLAVSGSTDVCESRSNRFPLRPTAQPESLMGFNYFILFYWQNGAKLSSHLGHDF
jgi:hypothetical protein